MSDKWYDKIRFMAVILLPALGTLYFTLAPIWGLPKADEVVGTIVAIDTFLGIVLQISKKRYDNSDARFDGEVNLSPDEYDERTNLHLMLDKKAAATKDAVLVKVNRTDIPS